MTIMNLEKNFVVKTTKDNKEHRYFTEFSYDKSIDSPMGTATLKCPWSKELWSYWEPITQTVGVKGGVYDDLWLFIGRVRGISLNGQDMEISLQDIGWKIKQMMPQDFYEKKVKNKTIYSVLVDITNHLGFDKSYIKLNVGGDYAFDKDGNLKHKGEDIYKIPDVLKSIKNTPFYTMRDNIMNDGIDTAGILKDNKTPDSRTFFIPQYPEYLRDYTDINISYSKQEKKDIERLDKTQNPNDNKPTISVKARPSCGCCMNRTSFPYVWKKYTWINQCVSSTCKNRSHKGIGQLYLAHDKPGKWMTKLDGQITCKSCSADYCGVCGGDTWGKDSKGLRCARIKLIPATEVELKNQKKSKGGAPYTPSFTADKPFTKDSATKSLSIIAGEKTFEDIITEICKKTDSICIVRNNDIWIGTFSWLYKEIESLEYLSNKFDGMNAIYEIQPWQIENDSFKLDVSEFGYYNTVYVKYKNGTIKKSYDDLVRVFGEVPKVFSEPKIDKETATLRANAYLSAYIRDFGLKVEATIIGSGRFFPGTFCRIPNPETGSIGRYFISNVRTDWDADKGLMTSLTLLYGPGNPDNPEIPEVGDAKQDVTVGGQTWTDGTGAQKGATHLADPGSGVGYKDECKLSQLTIDTAKKYKNGKQVCQYATRNWNYSFYKDYTHCPDWVIRNRKGNCMDMARAVVHICKANGIEAKMSNKTMLKTRSGGVVGHFYAWVKYNGKYQKCDPTTRVNRSRNPLGI